MKPENHHIDPAGILPKIFSGEASPEEKELINDWISADDANRETYDSFRKLWNFTATVPSEIDINKEWQKMDSLIESRHVRKLLIYRILKVAASLLILATLTFTGIRISSHESVKVTTGLASVDLIDGTMVTLNAGSRIRYGKGFGMKNRNLTLEGEAFFNVGHNPIPFVINAGGASITVTGTQFNVKAYTGRPEIKVTVTEGIVKMYRTNLPGDEIDIHAGETGKYDKETDHLVKINTVNSNDLAWKTRILDFRNTPFSEVADVLSSTYHIPLKIDTVLNRCLVTVRFENQDAEAVLKVLQSTLNLTVTKKGKKILITGKGC